MRKTIKSTEQKLKFPASNASWGNIWYRWTKGILIIIGAIGLGTIATIIARGFQTSQRSDDPDINDAINSNSLISFGNSRKLDKFQSQRANTPKIVPITNEFYIQNEDDISKHWLVGAALRGEELGNLNDYISVCYSRRGEDPSYTKNFACSLLNYTNTADLPQFLTLTPVLIHTEGGDLGSLFSHVLEIPVSQRFLGSYDLSWGQGQQFDIEGNLYLSVVDLNYISGAEVNAAKNFIGEFVFQQGRDVTHKKINLYSNGIISSNRVNTCSSSASLGRPTITAFPDGGYGISYTMNECCKNKAVMVQFYDVDENKRGSEICVVDANTTATYTNYGYSSIINQQGKGAVIFQGPDQSAYGQQTIFMQLFDPVNATKIGQNEYAFPASFGTQTLVSAFSILNHANFLICCLASDGKYYLRQFSLLNGESFQALSDPIQLEINNLADQWVSFFPLSHGQFMQIYSQTGTNQQNGVGRIYATEQSYVPKFVNNVLTVDRAKTVILSSTYLKVTDMDTPPSSLVISVDSISHGQFERLNNPYVPITSFTMAEVNQGKILFRHDGSKTGPGYTLSATDGQHSAGPNVAVVSFIDPHDYPVLASIPTGLTVQQGAVARFEVVNCTSPSDDYPVATSLTRPDYTPPPVWLKLEGGTTIVANPDTGIPLGDTVVRVSCKDNRAWSSYSDTTIGVGGASTKSSSETPVWRIVLPAVMTPVGLTGTCILCSSSLLATMVSGALCFVGRQQYSEQRAKRTSRKEDYLAFLTFKEIGAPYDCSDFRSDKGREFREEIRNILKEAGIDAPSLEDFTETKILAKKLAKAIKQVIRKNGYHHYARKLIGFHFSLFLCGCFQPGSTANFLKRHKAEIVRQLNNLMNIQELQQQPMKDSTAMTASLLQNAAPYDGALPNALNVPQGGRVSIVREIYYIHGANEANGHIPRGSILSGMFTPEAPNGNNRQVTILEMNPQITEMPPESAELPQDPNSTVPTSHSH